MSRVIVKNLPPKATEKTLSELFAQCGEVTDARLIRTRTGLSRKFGFVGLVSDSQAQRAVETFDRSFIGSARISVEVAKPYGDESLQRPWSKYSRGSSAFAKRDHEKKNRELEKRDGVGEKDDVKSGKQKKSVAISELCDIEEEEEFQEFLSIHTPKSQVKTWADGGLETSGKKVKRKTSKRRLGGGEGEMGEEVETEEGKRRKISKLGVKVEKVKVLDSSQTRDGSAGESACEEDMEDREAEEEGEGEEEEGDEEEEEVEGEGDKGEGEDKGCSQQRNGSNIALTTGNMTDLDYLQSKVVTELTPASDDDSEMASDGGAQSESTDSGDEESESNKEEAPTNQSLNEFSTTLFTLRMRGLPFKSKREDVETFFHPLALADVRFTVDKDGRPSGRAYVDFNSEEDMNEALKRNGDCIGKRYIELFRDEGPQSMRREGESEKKREFGGRGNEEEEEEEDETIADSGRLFLRNLSFTVKEDDLMETFEQFGPLTEVTVPLDKTTNRPTGLGFVTFMLPEHAVRAYEALDGQVYQGRLLHILPGRQRRGRHQAREESEESKSGSSFKKKKEREQKSQSGSGHNWNALFLGANSVVDAMSRRYSTSKSSILDPESESSAAVRMALGETQLVSETREFLEAEGVQLDVFEKKNLKRSLTVILVKNLPHGTKQSELQELFSPFGSLHKVILPPAGISAVVEFLESSHAKAAFKRLAYSKFKHLPLYLEWAPVGVMGEKKRERKEKGGVKGAVGEGGVEGESGEVSDGKEEKKGEEREEEEEKGDGEGYTLFVKNLNFSSNEEGLRNVFARVEGLTKVEVARKRNMKDPSQLLSMGFGFVEFSAPEQAQQALKDYQHREFDGHRLELKLSHRTKLATGDKSGRKSAKKREQKSAKIMVRNIPFEATLKEVRELFQAFGQLKTVRLPKKMASMGRHRGFGFVEFMTKEDARRAFESLCYSTHLYGRRLVLEWAEGDESVEDIRKRTADHFHGLQGAAANVSSKRRKAEFLLYGSSRERDMD